MQDVNSDDPKLELRFLLHVLDADMHQGDMVGNEPLYFPSPNFSSPLASLSSPSPYSPYHSPPPSGRRSKKRSVDRHYSRVEEKILGNRRRSSSGAGGVAFDAATAAASTTPTAGAGAGEEDGFVTVAVVLRFRRGAEEQHAWAIAVRLAVENLPNGNAIFER